MLSKKIIPSPPSGWDTWESLMDCALEEADKAQLKGEVPVGAIVVSAQGMIIGKGHNTSIEKKDPTGHAEINALREAALFLCNYRLTGCYLVVTLEPCMMCTGAIVHSRLKGLVYGTKDSCAGTINSCLDGLDEPFHTTSVWHMGGIKENACKKILQNFFINKRK